MKIYVIGIGLIGGSMALDLKDLDPDHEIIGVDTNEAHLDEALSLGIIGQKGALDTLNEADRVILSIPVKDSSFTSFTTRSIASRCFVVGCRFYQRAIVQGSGKPPKTRPIPRSASHSRNGILGSQGGAQRLVFWKTTNLV